MSKSQFLLIAVAVLLGMVFLNPATIAKFPSLGVGTKTGELGNYSFSASVVNEYQVATNCGLHSVTGWCQDTGSRIDSYGCTVWQAYPQLSGKRCSNTGSTCSSNCDCGTTRVGAKTYCSKGNCGWTTYCSNNVYEYGGMQFKTVGGCAVAMDVYYMGNKTFHYGVSSVKSEIQPYSARDYVSKGDFKTLYLRDGQVVNGQETGWDMYIAANGVYNDVTLECEEVWFEMGKPEIIGVVDSEDDWMFVRMNESGAADYLAEQKRLEEERRLAEERSRLLVSVTARDPSQTSDSVLGSGGNVSLSSSVLGALGVGSSSAGSVFGLPNWLFWLLLLLLLFLLFVPQGKALRRRYLKI